MIHLYIGEGKGKTTAAIGLAVRAAGGGMKVLFSQFMKGNDTGELHSLEKIPNIQILRSEKQYGFYKNLSESEKKELTAVHNQMMDKLLEAAYGGYAQMIILDEITYPVAWNLVDAEKLKTLLQNKRIECVLTGRNPAEFMLDCADYITEMRKIRHPYERGVKARMGVEY